MLLKICNKTVKKIKKVKIKGTKEIQSLINKTKDITKGQ